MKRGVLIAACVVQTGVLLACIVAWPQYAMLALAGLAILAMGLMPE